MNSEWQRGELKLAFEHARSVTAEYARSFYMASKLLPEKMRWATWGLYGFCRAADNIVDNPRDRETDVLHHELDELSAEIVRGFEYGESQNPVVAPLVAVAREYAIPADYPLALVEGVRMDLNRTNYATFTELYLFCYRVAGVVGLMMSHVLGAGTAEAKPHAEALGVAMQLTNILRDIQEDLYNGRLYLPLNELEEAGVSLDSVRKEQVSDELRSYIAEQIERARRFYRLGEEGIEYLAPQSRFAIRTASHFYEEILDVIEERNYNPFLGRSVVPKGRKYQLLLKNAIAPATRQQNERDFHPDLELVGR